MTHNTPTHLSYETSTCSAPGCKHRNRWLSEFPDIVDAAVEYAQRNAHKGYAAYTDVYFYDDEPLLQFSLSIRTIHSGEHYPVTGHSIPVDTDAVEIFVSGFDLAHPDCVAYLQQAIARLPKGSQIRTTQPRMPDTVEVL